MKWLRRNVWRILALLAASAAALGFLSAHCPQAVSFFTRLSPILGLLGALSCRAWLGWSMLLGVPIIVLSFFRGRIFCWKICPVGFITESVGKINPRGKTLIGRIPPLNKALLLVITVTAACGYPLFIWLDPFCMFNGFFAAFKAPFTLASASIGLVFAAVMTLSAIVPNVWCHRLCPLGGLQETVSRLSDALRREKTADAPPSMKSAVTRRTLLAAVPAAAAGIVTSRVLGPNGRKAIRPPGCDVERINALCARCGNCMQACPYQLIKPDLGESGIDGLFTPVLKFRSKDADQEQYCFQDCVKCSQVCPTGALRPVSIGEKQRTSIGIAVVNRRKCIAWENNEYCAVCDEYCPFKAVKLVKHGDVMCPIVDKDKCRGCGACESACPAEPIAIVVK